MAKPSKREQITKEEVNAWIRAYQQNGDKEAQDKLVRHYNQLVDSIARKYSRGDLFMKIFIKLESSAY